MTRVLHTLVREALAELSDAAYQERVWTASDGPEIGSLTEAVARLFDDSGLGDALAGNQEVYGAVADEMLRDLDARLSQIDEGRSPSSIIADPEIEGIRLVAAALLREPKLSDRTSEGGNAAATEDRSWVGRRESPATPTAQPEH